MPTTPTDLFATVYSSFRKLLPLPLLMSLLTLLSVSPALAQEKLPLLKAGTDVYTDITVTSVSQTDVYFTYAKGMGNVKLKNLEPAMQRHFNYDPAAGHLVEQQQLTNASRYYQQALQAPRSTPPSAEPDSDRLAQDPRAEMEQAVIRVRQIVNQPVAAVTPTPGKGIAHYPGWFHPGAIKPDFDTVDVHATQELSYTADLVVSDQDPNHYYRGSDLEFNSMTKFFYRDRSVPKRRLSSAEMDEINRLYRIIGRCEQAGVTLGN